MRLGKDSTVLDFNAVENQRAVLTIVGAEPPLSPSEQALMRSEVEAERERLAATGLDLCRVLGITSTWGATRWTAGRTRDLLVPTFGVTVHGEVPTRATTLQLIRRLTKLGWRGTVPSFEPLRLDAKRAGTSMRLSARAGRVTLTVTGLPIRLDRTLAKLILAGVYEDEESSEVELASDVA